MTRRKMVKLLLLFVPCYVGGFLLNCFVGNDFVFEPDFTLLFSGTTLLYGFVIFGIVGCLYLNFWFKNYWLRNSKKLMNTTTKDLEVAPGLEQNLFQTKKEMAKNFETVEWSDLPKTKIEGIPIYAEQDKSGYHITFAKSSHALIIGTTGSGKTTTFINPAIQILANTKTMPSMLVSDPKGELYSLHAAGLEKRGYEIKVLDLRNPYRSIRWNPLEHSFLQYQRALKLHEEATEQDGKWIFEGKTFDGEDAKNLAVQIKKQEINDEIYEDLNDVISVLCPVLNKSEPIWESGAKNFILAIVLAILEDSENPELGMTVEKFNFYNLMKVATNTQNECEDLLKYFQGRSPISRCVSLAKQVLDASDKTRGSYLSTVFDKLNLFADMSICSLTSKNEIDFSVICERPTVLFLQIPDERETRHPLAAMVLLQAYKALVQKASTYPDLSLPRSVYFLLDEFGNLPKVHKLEQMITVGRSRKIWLALVVQSYAQLNKVYEDKSADIIKSNCNTQIFIGTTDLRTIEEFSKQCGNYSFIQRSTSFSMSKTDDISSSASIKERPLIYPSELQQLNSPGNMGNAIVNVFGFPPIKARYTPSYECTAFKLVHKEQTYSLGHFFDEGKIFYNMLDRNEKLFPSRKPRMFREEMMDGDKDGIARAINLQIVRLPKDIFNPDEHIAIQKQILSGDFDGAIEALTLVATRTEDNKQLHAQILRNIKKLKDASDDLKLGKKGESK